MSLCEVCGGKKRGDTPIKAKGKSSSSKFHGFAALLGDEDGDVMHCAASLFFWSTAISPSHSARHTENTGKGSDCTAQRSFSLAGLRLCRRACFPLAPASPSPRTTRSRRHHHFFPSPDTALITSHVVRQQPDRGHACGGPSLGQDEQDGTFLVWRRGVASESLFPLPFSRLIDLPTLAHLPPTHRTRSCST